MNRFMLKNLKSLLVNYLIIVSILIPCTRGETGSDRILGCGAYFGVASVCVVRNGAAETETAALMDKCIFSHLHHRALSTSLHLHPVLLSFFLSLPDFSLFSPQSFFSCYFLSSPSHLALKTLSLILHVLISLLFIFFLSCLFTSFSRSLILSPLSFIHLYFVVSKKLFHF